MTITIKNDSKLIVAVEWIASTSVCLHPTATAGCKYNSVSVVMACDLRYHHVMVDLEVVKNIDEEVYHEKDVMMKWDVVVVLFDVELLSNVDVQNCLMK